MNKRVKKIVRISLISLSILLIAFVGIIWYIANNLEEIIVRTLIEEVEKSTNGLYNITG